MSLDQEARFANSANREFTMDGDIREEDSLSHAESQETKQETLAEKFLASVQSKDNEIFVLSGRDVHSFGFNNNGTIKDQVEGIRPLLNEKGYSISYSEISWHEGGGDHVEVRRLDNPRVEYQPKKWDPETDPLKTPEEFQSKILEPSETISELSALGKGTVIRFRSKAEGAMSTEWTFARVSFVKNQGTRTEIHVSLRQQKNRPHKSKIFTNSDFIPTGIKYKEWVEVELVSPFLAKKIEFPEES